ncbi:MAG: DNA helicase UvrD [Betaproteobacteria bacterium]
MSLKQIAIAVDQLANTLLGGFADETISARAHRNGWKRTERFINFLFQDDQHCAMAYVSEMRGTQNAQEYRNA